VGIGLQGQYGMLLESGALGEEFGSGPGLAVRLRYRMRYERALGLSFEGQAFDARSPADTVGSVTRMRLILSGLELYQMFDTRTNTHKNLAVGVGLAQVSKETNDDQTEYPGDGLYVSLGGGVESFFWGTLAIDLSARYMALFQEGGANHDFQASAGLIFYAGY
jgi:hypothetical protein